MYYVINVALNGNHFFATTEHSLIDEEKAKTVFEELKKRFPNKEGYIITVTAWSTTGKTLDW